MKMFLHLNPSSTISNKRDEHVIPDHKLCGYFITALSLNSTPATPIQPLRPCLISNSPKERGFRALTDAGRCLIYVSPPIDLELNRPNTVPSCDESSSRKMRKRSGSTSGILSVFEQMETLTSRKCISTRSVLLQVDTRNGSMRAVLLVDVYIPISAWAGWQFHKSAAVGGMLFQHLSCDWERRRALLNDVAFYSLNNYFGDLCIWKLPRCHVLGCKLHCKIEGISSNKKRFELPELFKCMPSISNLTCESQRVMPADGIWSTGIYDASDDILLKILSSLGSMDLVRVAATCRHFRSLAMLVMPFMKLQLYPHQQAAVEWMLQRERITKQLPHPLYVTLCTIDGSTVHVNTVSGEINTGELPKVRDFCGGMFCDEPGLGKTITALSLILKTRGRIAEPPESIEVSWCAHNSNQRCGYYDLADGYTPMSRRILGEISSPQTRRRRSLLLDSEEARSNESTPMSQIGAQQINGTKNVNSVAKNLMNDYDEALVDTIKNSRKRKRDHGGCSILNETWVQCDACHKWRRVNDSIPQNGIAWFCSMNTDAFFRSCRVPEESSNGYEVITHLPGFCAKGEYGGKEENVSFFVSILKEHYGELDQLSKKALIWLADLTSERLSEMETVGLVSPILGTFSSTSKKQHGFHKIFRAIGFRREVIKSISRWYYPKYIDDLSFDVASFRIALSGPLDSVRMYLSGATLIVVPANLVEHWKTQIEKHVTPYQLRVCVWTDNRRPSAHNLSWDYDIVITTFNRLSAEWSARNKSPLMQVHWLRIMLDEGHTLGSSLTMTNKLQMATSLVASSRWLLTGTPMPNTPETHLSHLLPMLKFLHEETYGWNSKLWEAAISKPFENEMEEGRMRLLQLLSRCLISSRKSDLRTIPPCVKKVTLLNFNKDHARSYNELVLTVKRNILMADWNDPSHIESLLNPKQWKFRSATVNNVRLSCCVAGHIRVTEVGEDIKETMDLLSQSGLDPLSEEYGFIKYTLQYGGVCARCKEWCRLPFVTPCRHILCIACVALDSEKCTFPGCGFLYEMEKPKLRIENPNPKWPVPKDLIELQPSYKQDDWDPDWQSTSSSKVAYLVQRLTQLQEGGSRSYQVSEKVIIFSQFLEHIHVIEQQLSFADIRFVGLYSPMQSSHKMKSLEKFQHDPSCTALIMDGSAALGLDLSFVAHVFLMEPIWDRSVEDQVISRAHRMGATRPVHVETLAMRGTIEDQMLDYLKDVRSLKKEDLSSLEVSRPQKFHDFAESTYLSKLHFVHTS